MTTPDDALVASSHDAATGAPVSFFVSNGDEYLPTELTKDHGVRNLRATTSAGC